LNIFLFDTDILIDHLKGKSAATIFLKNCLDSKAKLACSVITEIEILSGMVEEEKNQIERFLSGFERIEVNLDIARIAGLYMNQYRKSHNVNIADAIIAASAKYARTSLYTLNKKQYPMSDIEIIKPYHK